MRNGGWPLEAGFHGQALNRFKLLFSKATVVSVEEKALRGVF
jgi:hypothetical protein